MTLQVRSETTADVPAVESVTARAFLNAAHTSHTEQFIVNALRNAGKLAISLVADADGRLVGHVALSAVEVSDGTAGWFGLGPVSVLPEHQRRGIGSLLIREALQWLQDQGAAGCVVLGEPAYYNRFGFKAVPDLILTGVPPEYFQALSFGGPLPHGVVSYHTAFDARQ